MLKEKHDEVLGLINKLTLKVNEIFYSLQGEGARAGAPSIFIRLSDCDLTCGFCDTQFTSGKVMTLNEIIEYIKQWPCNEIVWTGGEPALQLTEAHIRIMHYQGYYNCIETNGGHKVPKGLDWVCVSPKVATHVLNKNFERVNEIKYVVHKGTMSLPYGDCSVTADHYFLSPQFDGENINKENLKQAIKLCLEYPPWKLSVQTHKLWKIN